MLKIFNDLTPFFKDSYQRINVRKYAKLMKISPPTASTLLSVYEKEGLLKVEKNEQYIYYYANIENALFVGLSREFWKNQIEKSGILKKIETKIIADCIILFGSFSKAEITSESDIDIAIFTSSTKKLDLDSTKELFGREIQYFIFKDLTDVKNNELKKNIMNGLIIKGGW
jgi:predicted nucleotidyltransferase